MGKPIRVNVNVRVLPASLEWLDGLVRSTGHRRSTVIRVALAVARRHSTEVEQTLRDTTT